MTDVETIVAIVMCAAALVWIVADIRRPDDGDDWD